jgi:iron complex transport system ATP-binding protein
MHEISDGERQRAFIARALAQDASVLILDEPTAFLDLPRRLEIVRLLARLAKEDGRAIAMSTHDLDLALQTADELWLISKDGQFRSGVPEELVLDGSFEEVFAAEGSRFDRESGRFQWRESAGPRFHVRGTGSRAVWTAHGLRRIGCAVIDGGEPADWTAQVNEDGWTLVGPTLSRQFDSLGEFLLAVEQDRLASCPRA